MNKSTHYLLVACFPLLLTSCTTASETEARTDIPAQEEVQGEVIENKLDTTVETLSKDKSIETETDNATENTEETKDAEPDESKTTEGSETIMEEYTAIGDKGLKCKILTPGTGEEATAGHRVSVHYTGWTVENGEKKVFDSSHSRNQPFAFPLGAGMVIRGWDLGVEGMRIGEKRELFIPSELAYGSRAAGSIKPNSDLYFEVELLGVSKIKR